MEDVQFVSLEEKEHLASMDCLQSYCCRGWIHVGFDRDGNPSAGFGWILGRAPGHSCVAPDPPSGEPARTPASPPPTGSLLQPHHGAIAVQV